MNNHERFSSERGQSLVLLVIMMIAFLAILALALDGGMLFANRRRAQNAADAGALAGARELCIIADEVQAENEALFMAHQYAVVHNDADTSVETVQDNMVTVTTTISFDAFFAHFIGFPDLTAQASATAGCFNPGLGERVLPVAWICRPPISEFVDERFDCEERPLTMDQLEDRLTTTPTPGPIHPELYILMDGTSLDDMDDICISAGGNLDCDLDDDGEDDLQGGGDTSWLYLHGEVGGGDNVLTDWIDDGYPGIIEEHTWLWGKSGVDTNVYHTAADHVGEIAAIPVYDRICMDHPDTCDQVEAGDIIPDGLTANSPYYFRVVGFAAFYIACVDPPGPCPGHNFAVDEGVFAANTKTIEGYFVTGYIPGLGGGTGGGGINTGAYTLYLVK